MALLKRIPWLPTSVLLLVFLATDVFAGFDTNNEPLKPIDNSSPRGTLVGFMDAITDTYRLGVGSYVSYLHSDALFMSPNTAFGFAAAQKSVVRIKKCFDFSGLPPATSKESSRRLVIQLKEVLDRIKLPPVSEIPDKEMMKSAGITKWVIPDTEITLERIEEGPRAGEYIFSPSTLEQVPEFYDLVKNQPYRITSTAGWYDLQTHKPLGVAIALQHLIPPRWILTEDSGWLVKTQILKQPIWRWIGMLVLSLFVFIWLKFTFHLSVKFGSSKATLSNWAPLLRPFSLAIASVISTIILSDLLRVSDQMFRILVPGLWGIFYLSITWFVWDLGSAIAETIIESEKLSKKSISSQLIRFVTRLLNLALVITLLVIGGQRIGLPTYSIVASIGISGLAIALAAQQTLANLLGSLIIMFEKPFVIGNTVVIGGNSGVVRSVGFRSTWIRTPKGSTVSIPNSQVITTSIETLDRHGSNNRIAWTLKIRADVNQEALKAYLAALKSLIYSHETIDQQESSILLNGVSEGMLEIKITLKHRSKCVDETGLSLREKLVLEITDLTSNHSLKLKSLS